MAESSTGNARIDAFAALRAGEALQPFHYSLGSLGPTEVDIAITHCGICHSDLHLMFRFSAKHAIMPMREPYSMKEVNQALARLRQNRVRCRAVLVNES